MSGHSATTMRQAMTHLISLLTLLGLMLYPSPAARASARKPTSSSPPAPSAIRLQCRYYVFLPAVLTSNGGGSGTPSPAIPAQADFNGDGYADLAIGVPGEDVAGTADAGAVNILYGGISGLSVDGNQIFTQQDTPSAVPEQDDAFGSALTAGDFDGNGCTDLVVGVPDESVGTTDDAGAVYVFYGFPQTGLDASTVEPWYQGKDIHESVETLDYFGAAMAAGDFDQDGDDDLVVGAPLEELDGQNAAGVIHVLQGSPTGITSSGDQYFSQTSIGSDSESLDQFGSAFAVGDYDGDGHPDLAIGSPGETLESANASESGAVYVLYGTPNGLNSADSDATLSVYAEEHFGSALAAGDFDGDGLVDLAIGAPDHSETVPSGGRVVVYEGHESGMFTGDSITIDRGSAAAEDDYLGSALAVGNFNADGAADLVIGVPGESSIADSAGAIWVLHGVVGSGLPTSYDQFFQQRNIFADSAEANDEFGSALTTGDYDASGSSDLAVGVPSENLETYSANLAGGVQTIFSNRLAGPLQLNGNSGLLWTQAGGVAGAVEAFDYFGQTVR